MRFCCWICLKSNLNIGYSVLKITYYVFKIFEEPGRTLNRYDRNTRHEEMRKEEREHDEGKNETGLDTREKLHREQNDT